MRYKVEFENNRAITATLLNSIAVPMRVEFAGEGHIDGISTIIIDAENETEALTCADEIVEHIWNDLLVGKDYRVENK